MSDSRLGDSGSRPTSQEWLLIEKMLMETHREQKKARRWGIFFKVLVFVYIFAALILLRAGSGLGGVSEVVEDHVAVVPVQGVIAADADASANAVVTGLRRAFEAAHSTAVILTINSPGGSPVQSGYINEEIYRLKALYPDKKVYAAISDIGASGAYYIAVAADEIYADKASLVGSIGVTASGFGFVDLMAKLGVERRAYSSGEHKGFLDPFAPQQEGEVAFWQSVLKSTHDQFISVVRRGRGNRLRDVDDLFTGLVWNGEQALTLGLIDGLGSAGYVAREVVGVDKLVDYGVKPNPLEAVLERLGVAVGRGVAQQAVMEQPLKLH